jgi:hypothetical protein
VLSAHPCVESCPNHHGIGGPLARQVFFYELDAVAGLFPGHLILREQQFGQPNGIRDDRFRRELFHHSTSQLMRSQSGWARNQSAR